MTFPRSLVSLRNKIFGGAEYVLASRAAAASIIEPEAAADCSHSASPFLAAATQP